MAGESSKRSPTLDCCRLQHRSKLTKRTGAPSLPHSVSAQHASSDDELALSGVFRALLGHSRAVCCSTRVELERSSRAPSKGRTRTGGAGAGAEPERVPEA